MKLLLLKRLLKRFIKKIKTIMSEINISFVLEQWYIFYRVW